MGYPTQCIEWEKKGAKRGMDMRDVDGRERCEMGGEMMEGREERKWYSCVSSLLSLSVSFFPLSSPLL